MRQSEITYQEKLDELILDIKHPTKKGFIFILVEGKSDIRLFRKLFDSETCCVETTNVGKSALEPSLEKLLKETPYVIGIEDADFRHLDNKHVLIPNLFFTDYHDIEMTLIAKDEVFSALLNKYTKLPPSEHLIIRAQLMQLIAQMSLLKWLNEKESLSLNFKKQDFTDLLSFSLMAFEFNTYYSQLLNTTYKELTKKKINEDKAKAFNKNAKSFDYIQDKINDLATQSFDEFQLCNGHDFIKTLVKYLRDHQSDLNESGLSGCIRTVCSKSIFSETKLFQSINQWAMDKQLSVSKPITAHI